MISTPNQTEVIFFAFALKFDTIILFMISLAIISVHHFVTQPLILKCDYFIYR